MRKLEFSEILNVLCEDLGLTPNFSRPFSYNTFKQIMLYNDLIVTERVIRTKWEQLLAREDIITKGQKSNGEFIATINVQAARSYIYSKGKKPWSMMCESETHSANTQTHTKEESQ